jgi:hypothetical protein
MGARSRVSATIEIKVCLSLFFYHCDFVFVQMISKKYQKKKN